MLDLLCSCFESDKEEYKTTSINYTKKNYTKKYPPPIDTRLKKTVSILKRPVCINTKRLLL